MLSSYGLVVLTLVVTVLAKELPSYVPICKRTDPRLNECVKKATSTLQPYFIKGIPELNIPSFEPLRIPMVKLEQGTAAINYKLKLSDVKAYGLSNFKFTSIKVDLAKHLIQGQLQFPRVRLVADYIIDGRALLIPVRGDGVFTANLTDIHANADLFGTIVKRKGQEYWRIMDTKVNLNIGGASTDFTNLFGGDSILSSTTNAFLNQNSKEIIEEVKPAVEVVVAMIADDIANNFLRVSPYSKILPP